MTNDFLPEGYEAPQSEGGYLKLEKGENKLRILSKPIIGWVDWENNKPLRYIMDEKPKNPADPTKPIRHFWAFVVWDYKTSAIKILEITQKTIQSAITTLSKDDDWGSPFGYDIKITRVGDGMETEYHTNPVPHKELNPKIAEIYKATQINLNALFESGDPFSQGKQGSQVKQETKSTPQANTFAEDNGADLLDENQPPF